MARDRISLWPRPSCETSCTVFHPQPYSPVMHGKEHVLGVRRDRVASKRCAFVSVWPGTRRAFSKAQFPHQEMRMFEGQKKQPTWKCLRWHMGGVSDIYCHSYDASQTTPKLSGLKNNHQSCSHRGRVGITGCRPRLTGLVWNSELAGRVLHVAGAEVEEGHVQKHQHTAIVYS